MAVIKVSSDEFSSLANELLQLANETRNLNARLEDVTCRLNSSWDSSASYSLFDALNRARQSDEEKIQIIESVAQQLMTMVAAYQETENSILSSFRKEGLT